MLLLKIAEKLYFDEVIRRKCLSAMSTMEKGLEISKKYGLYVGRELKSSRVIDMMCFTMLLGNLHT